MALPAQVYETTSTLVPLPAPASTTTSWPRAVSRTSYVAGSPSRVTAETSAPSGSTCPIVSSADRSRVTVVVSVEAVRSAETSTDPSPSTMLLPATRSCPSGTSGTTARAPRPRSGLTPSWWWTTG